jgi:hypothetical protein
LCLISQLDKTAASDSSATSPPSLLLHQTFIMAVAIQPAITRPMSTGHVPIASAAACSPAFRRHPASSPKEELHVQAQSQQSQPLKPTVVVPTSTLSTIRSRRERPCDACRRRKSRCVIKEGLTICVLCEFHKQDCTFVQEPQPRKRKVPQPNDTKDTNSKKR